jgi:hypothetical protein
MQKLYPFYDQKKPLNEKVATKQKKLQKERIKNSMLYVGEGSILRPLHLYIKTSGFL